MRWLRGIGSVAIVAMVVACGAPTPSTSAGPTASASGGSPSPAASASASAGASASIVSTEPLATTGAIAVLTEDGSLAVVDAAGRRVPVADASDGVLGFPAWSPDGTRIAATRLSRTEDSIVVFDAATAGSGAAAEPVVILQSASIDPFYLYWIPDGSGVSYLASEAGSLAMRIAPADGSAPVDGSGPGAKVRSGNPIYYDWIGQDRLLAHIGVGADAFLGEIGLDGEEAAPALDGTGNFRSAIVSHDQVSIGFVRTDESGTGEIVVSARDGSREQGMPVLGSAAILFDPTGDTMAAIGPTDPNQAAAGFPLGPVRLIDASTGDVRTLIDGLVVGFWWSPDGSTIAALRVQPVEDAGATLVPQPSASAEPDTEVRLLFVDVASGEVSHDPVVRPAPRFVTEILAFFDQYSLSHRVWAPDSSSIVLPEATDQGTTQLTVHFADGRPAILVEGEIGFWSP